MCSATQIENSEFDILFLGEIIKKPLTFYNIFKLNPIFYFLTNFNFLSEDPLASKVPVLLKHRSKTSSS